MAKAGKRNHQQELGLKVWRIIELFYKSFLTFRELHDRYEANIARLCAETGKAPEALLLGPQALADLIDLRKLEALRDRYLYDLKQFCHQVFRDRGETDFLDRYVSDIFHEVSILKEEHYNVKFYALGWQERNARIEYDSIMSEASTIFPQKVRHLDYLFERAKDRLEKLLPSIKTQKVVMRSLFLNRTGFVSECYPGGLDDFYRILYPENGPLEGYYEVGLSLLASGFLEHALSAFHLGLEAAAREPRRTTVEKRMTRSIKVHVKEILRAFADRGLPAPAQAACPPTGAETGAQTGAPAGM
ncbi:MAG: hypothetical protein JXP34_08120 [Planctomycetes bacterium]|nr:hypothetical protein [Planctomycetota bacterium]